VSTQRSALERLLRAGPRSTVQARPGLAQQAQRLAWAWWLLAGVLLFAAWWLQGRGLWQALVEGDPSGISLVILALGLVGTLWCGHRAWALAAQAQAGSPWRLAHRRQRAQDAALAPQLLAEQSHGPHETAWWFAAAAVKLGLLGTVVGFIVMASRLAATGVFEVEQIQALLQQMTRGMAIALYTTLVGLVVNLGLGLQLLLLDRLADQLAADILAEGSFAEVLQPALQPPPPAAYEGPP
jgi:hypothetical protein